MAVLGMADDFKGFSPNSRLLVGEMPAPSQLKTSWWEGTGVSILAHVVILGALLYAATHVKEIVDMSKKTTDNLEYILVAKPTPGPGGGGGGRPKDPEPARKAEIVPAKQPDTKPIPKPVDVPTPEVTVPIQTPTSIQTLPGALSSIDATVGATGQGGGGRGTGIGTGNGSGVGDGSGGGYGGGPFQPGSGINNPVLIREVKPNYTGEAMRAKLQGIVEMEAVVLADGSVDPKSIRITRSLDANLGLDQQAIIAVKQWRFRPGTCGRQQGCGGIPFGQPIPVIVSVELTFTLR